jgi:hypothetical protein
VVGWRVLGLLRIAGIVTAKIGDLPAKLNEALREIVHTQIIRFPKDDGRVIELCPKP